MRSPRVLLVAAVTLGLALASAGAAGAAPAAATAGSAAAAPAAATLTPAAYRAQASALCAQAKKRIAGLPKSTSAKPAQIAAALSKALTAVDPLLPQFRKLQPPAAMKATHDATVEGLADGLELGHGIAATIAKGVDLSKAMAKVQTPFLVALSTIQKGFKDLRLTACESVLGSAIGG